LTADEEIGVLGTNAGSANEADPEPFLGIYRALWFCGCINALTMAE